MSGVRRAAVDVGSNSVRVLVLSEAGETLAREMAITRMGRGVDERGHLDDGSLQLTLETIARFRDVWRDHGVDDAHVRIAATSAVRDAADRDRFFDGVRELTGIEAQVLSGDEEARTAFLGAAGAVDVDAPVTVLDIGGGSTEIVVGDDGGEVVGAISLQLGSVRLTERLLVADPPPSDQVDAARAEIRRQLEHADEALARQGVRSWSRGSLVAVAGTATTIAALDQGLETYSPDAIHGYRMSRAGVADVAERLLALPAARRADLGPIQPGREDVIHGGALILLGVIDHARLDEVVISESDILDGLAATAG